ncbi:MAG: hypothetical protein JST54_35595 [Deltaproteobacteria bacterium]|nr:hypothetical protein [Deltaproteobacteria bacterium]
MSIAIQATCGVAMVAVLGGCASGRPSENANNARSRYDGNYSLLGEYVDQPGACPAVVLAAHHLFVDLEGGTAFADVVQRTYPTKLENDALVAEGDFPTMTGCGDFHERWELSLSANGLGGTLRSRWKIPPSCTATCDAVFHIEAHRLRAQP